MITIAYEPEKRPASTISTDYKPVKRPANAMSTYSSISSIQCSEASMSSSSKSLLIFKPIKKMVPEMDKFAKRKKSKDDLIERELAEASSEISLRL